MAARPERPAPVRFSAVSTVNLRLRAVGRRRAPHEDFYYFILTRPWWQFFLFAATSFIGINALFAVAYALAPGSIGGARPGSFEDAFFFSVQTLGTIGYGGMTPVTRYAHCVVAVESLVGILSVALITGITFAKFARPTARVLFSQKAVVCPRDGVPHLMVRLANWRHNQVAEAQLRVQILIAERTREGEMMRRPIELSLVRSNTALFFLTWTVMHRIDETSPFYGPGAVEHLREAQAQIFLSFTGIDETIAQNIHARHMYQLDDIAWNARFADVLTTLDDGTRVVDYHRFHEIIPIPPEAAAPGAAVDARPAAPVSL